MAGKATVTVTGNVGNDPELKFTPNGKSVTSFSLASTPRYQKDGEWMDGDTTWFRCVVWDKFAETVNETVQKGQTLRVEGRLGHRTYTDKEGAERCVLEIIVDSLGIVPKAAKRDSAPAADDDPFNW